MQWLRNYRHTLITLLSMIALQAALYGHLPDPMPTHWNAAGAVDATLPKPWGVWILPLVFAPASLLLCVLPALSPANFSMTPFGRVFRAIVAVIAGFGLWMTGLVDLVALGIPIDMPTQVLCAVGVLFVILGNWMGKISQNFYVGIRTPWTLADATVWNRTHRIAGPWMMAAGLALVVTAVVAPHYALGVLIGAGGVAFLVPVVYSWWISPRTPNGGE
jgi:uncharacterized membrane protein